MTLLTALVTGLIGALAGASSNVFVEIFRRVSDGRALAAILSAEISTLLSIAAIRNYDAGAEQVLSRLREGQDVPIPNFLGDMEQWIRTYLENTKRLGLLTPSLANRVTQFYLLLQSVGADVSRLSLEQSPDVASKAVFVAETLSVWKSAQESGSQAVEELNTFAAKDFWWHVRRHL